MRSLGWRQNNMKYVPIDVTASKTQKIAFARSGPSIVIDHVKTVMIKVEETHTANLVTVGGGAT